MGWYHRSLRFAIRNEIDILSQNIARNVFNQIINVPKVGKIVINSIRSDNAQEDINLELCGIKKLVFNILYPEQLNQNDVIVKGDYDLNWNFPVIRVWIDFKTFTEKKYESLAQQLKYVIRHELEHSFHRKRDNALTPSFDFPDKEKTYSEIDRVNLVKKYLLDASEKDAYIRDLMLRAKNIKRPIEELIEEFVEEEFHGIKKGIENNEIINRIIEDIKNQYLQRVKQIYNKRTQT